MPEGQDATVPPAPPPSPGEESSTTPAGDLGITVALEQFSGPMDLLLYLVRRAEVDIKDLPVTVIADQFAAWVAAAAGTTLDLEAAGDFVVMAATLLEIKARMVAPPPEGTEVADDGEDEFDPRAGLIRKLLIYRAAKEAAFDLDRRDDQRRLRHHRGHREVVPDDAAEVDAWELKDVGAGTLANLWFDLLKRIDGLGPRTVQVDDVPMGVRMAQLVEDMRQRGEGRMSELFAIDSGPVARVSIVMAVLECTRQRQLRVGQAEQYGDVLIRFRAEDDRAITAGDPGPPEQLPKRQRRPPLVTWNSANAPATEGEEGEDADEAVIENEEQRFLRELESSVGVERLLARASDLEKGFIAWWEETHPGEPLPPGVVKPEPPPPPPPPPPVAVVEAKPETPAKPRRQPKPAAPPAAAEAQPEAPVQQPAATVTTAPVVEAPIIPDPSPQAMASVPFPPVGAGTAVPGDPVPAPSAVPDPTPVLSVTPADPAAATTTAPADPQPAAVSQPSFEVVPLAEAPPQPEAGPIASSSASAEPEAAEEPEPIVSAVEEPAAPVPPPLIQETAVVTPEPIVTESPVVPALQAAEAVIPVAEPEPVVVEPPVVAPLPAVVVAEAAIPAVEPDPVAPSPPAAVEPDPIAAAPPPPPPDPLPPPPPETANTPPIPATTTSNPSKPTPMSRPRHLKIAAVAALWLLSTVVAVAWFQRPGRVLTVSGPDNVVVARDGELAWTLNLALDPETRAEAELPKVEPPEAGSVAWRDERTCVFTPTGALPAGAALTVQFGEELRAKGGFRFDPEALPVMTVRTLAALTVADAAAAAPAFGEARIELALNRVPADSGALLADIAVSPAVPLTKAVVDGRVRLTGAFVPGTTYTVTVADTASGRADDRPLAWQGQVAIPARAPGARLAAGVGRQAAVEAVNLTMLVVENAAGARETLRFAPAVGDAPARAELPAWLLTSGENRLRLRWAGGEAEVVVNRHDLRLTPDDGGPVLLGGTLPVVSTR